MENLDVLKDHEKRIRKLEESDIRQQIQLANIEKSQAEIKVMISENSREQQKTLNDFTNKILTAFTSNVKDTTKTKNKIQFYNTKEFWAVVATLTTALVTYLISKGGIK